MWIFILAFTLFVDGGKTLDFCKLKDGHSDKCFISSIQSALKMLGAGSTQYGLKPLDPLHCDKITIGSGNGPVRLTQYYDNVNITGLSKIRVKNAYYDDATNEILISAVGPHVVQKAHYRADGEISAIQITGDGDSLTELVNVEFLLKLTCKKVPKNGKTYLKIVSVFLDIVPEKMKMHFENLFNGNKLLGDSVNKLINEEWSVLFADCKKEIERNYGELFRGYAQTLFDKVPCDQIFLKN